MFFDNFLARSESREVEMDAQECSNPETQSSYRAGHKHSPGWGRGVRFRPQAPGRQMTAGMALLESRGGRGQGRSGDVSLGHPVCGEEDMSEVYMSGLRGAVQPTYLILPKL